MPHFFFDTDDGDRSVHDSEGMDLPNPEEARRLVLGVLPDMARNNVPDGYRRTFAIAVRDKAGTTIYRATLSLEGEWISGGQPTVR